MSDTTSFEKVAKQWKELEPKIIKMTYELEAYQKIGGISTCAAAVANYTPATMIFPKGGYAICPICDHGVRVTDKYCSNCGKRLERGKKNVETQNDIKENETYSV